MKSKLLILLAVMVLLLVPCACSGEKNDPLATDAPSAKTDAPVPTEGFEIERGVLSGVPFRVDVSALISEGLEIDFDSDGTKERVEAEELNEKLYRLKSDGKTPSVAFTADDELWLVSLLGDRIDLAIKADATSDLDLYDHLKKEPEAEYELPSHSCFFVYRLDENSLSAIGPRSVQLFADSISDLPKCGSMEEYISQGAICGAAFIAQTNEFNDLSFFVDLDDDGSKESVLIRAPRAYACDPDSWEIIEEYPLPSEDDSETLLDEVKARGYGYREEDFLCVTVNDTLFDPMEEGNPAPLYPGSQLYLAPDPDGGIMLVTRASEFISFHWRDGSLTWEYYPFNED